jgi:hypothetical protein
LIQNWAQSGPLFGFGSLQIVRQWRLASLLFHGGIPGFERRAIRDSVQPPCDRSIRADRARPASKHEERRLKGVLGVVLVSNDPAADAQHHWTMELHQFRKRRLIIPLDELSQQLSIVWNGIDLAPRSQRVRTIHG